MKSKVIIMALILAVALAFSSGAFAYFVYPGQPEGVTQASHPSSPASPAFQDILHPAPSDRCERLWSLYSQAGTEAAARTFMWQIVNEPNCQKYP
jgi:hypothetical protein